MGWVLNALGEDVNLVHILHLKFGILRLGKTGDLNKCCMKARAESIWTHIWTNSKTEKIKWTSLRLFWIALLLQDYNRFRSNGGQFFVHFIVHFISSKWRCFAEVNINLLKRSWIDYEYLFAFLFLSPKLALNLKKTWTVYHYHLLNKWDTQCFLIRLLNLK